MAPWVCLQFVIVVFSDDTYLLILNVSVNYILTKINDIEILNVCFYFMDHHFAFYKKKSGGGSPYQFSFRRASF